MTDQPDPAHATSARPAAGHPPAAGTGQPRLDTSRPHPARRYDYRSRYAWGNDADPAAAMLDWWAGIRDPLARFLLARWSAREPARSWAPASARSQLLAEPAGERGRVGA